MVADEMCSWAFIIQSLITLGGRRRTLNFLLITFPSFSANAPNSSSLSIFCKVILMIPDKTILCSEHCLKMSMHLCKTRSGHNMFFLLNRRITFDSYIRRNPQYLKILQWTRHCRIAGFVQG